MAETVNIKKSYSKLNESLARLFDESGVRRSFTVPYLQGQEAKDHIDAVGVASSQNGGLAGNLLTSHHTAEGKGYGSGDGSTIGHPAEKLRQTMIPKDDKNAQAVIDAAQKCVTDFKFLLGDDDPTVQTAQGHLNLVKKTFGSGMSLQDFGVLMIQMMNKPMQAVAQAHNGQKSGGHQAQLRGPEAQQGQEAPETAQGGAQSADETSEASAAPESQGAPPAAQAAAPGQDQG